MVPLAEPLVFHAEPPMWIADGEARLGGNGVEVVGVDVLENRGIKVEAVAARVALDLPLHVDELRRHEPRMLGAEASLQIAEKLTAAVWTIDLPIAEQVHVRQQAFAEYLEGFFVVFAPVVAVGKLETVQVPFRRRKLLFDQLR